MAPIITLLTDFGLRDTYVGQVKGVLLSLCPQAALVDLTHEAGPQDVEEGAFLLETAFQVFPTGAVHLAVVDPGVGTSRRAIALDARGQFWVGPDNGLLSCALPTSLRPAEPSEVVLTDGVRAFELANPDWRSVAVSNTFHGRDVFAPAAARLARGESIEDAGPRLHTLRALPPFVALETEGRIEGRVLHVDVYGNLVSDVLEEQWGEGMAATLKAPSGEWQLKRFRTFGEAHEGDLFAYVASGGRVAVARRNGSAAALVGDGRRSLRLTLTRED
jgi:S-adenosylmethionine hydrolase